ncbi:MAG TPA: peptidoglycan recognition family protein [Phycisphaerales bacterium]|nr:peptidoglycan recognition family protein [Phycisphaerales bacterium]
MTTTAEHATAQPSFRPTRAQVVWCSLIASMTVVGGGLMTLQGGGVSAASAKPLAEIAPLGPATPGIESILQTKSPIEKNRWTGIVIHHSASAMGSAETLNAQSLAKGLKGLGYHFVIGNGQGAPNGQIYVGARWADQLPGAHTAGPKSEQYNRTTIGICLVGDGERHAFTSEQLDSLVQLVSTLQKELGIDDSQVFLHRDVAPTTSPGRLFPEALLRERLAAAQ